MSIGTARPFAPARDSCRRGSAAPPAAQPHCAADAGQHGQQARADQEDTPSVPGEEEDQEEEEEEEEDEVYVADADVADFVPLASDSEPMTDDDDADGDEVRGEAAAAEAGEAMEDGGAAEENVVDTSVQGFFAHKGLHFGR
ncbi:MAG: hypothetical protein BJ554DRAFT_1984 [Olpidium bornovanus]|uniref:Uncharacterized protein n=1 Tax=Olpidium bornovanus TaxID=278681 RepID=A0A8H7ZRI7_9FUNG|nr:MAG: hypothetical protein BJ554DRAFT_1984 [Olpidium bornovanus]